MHETIEAGGRGVHVYDLSHQLSNRTEQFEPNRHKIVYFDADQSAAHARATVGLDPEHDAPLGQLVGRTQRRAGSLPELRCRAVQHGRALGVARVPGQPSEAFEAVRDVQRILHLEAELQRLPVCGRRPRGVAHLAGDVGDVEQRDAERVQGPLVA
jgi:hypothetical protein